MTDSFCVYTEMMWVWTDDMYVRKVWSLAALQTEKISDPKTVNLIN